MSDQDLETADLEVEEEGGSGGAESGFPKVAKRFEDKGHNAFDDPAYYKTILSDGSELAKRLHANFQKYSACKDPKDKPVFRQQVSTVFWDFLGNVAKNAGGTLPRPKKYLLRFAMLHPGLLSAETRQMFSKVIDTNTLNQPVYYLDEWFGMIGRGDILPSTTDEAPVANSNTSARLTQLLEKANGKMEGTKGILRSKERERQVLEEKLRNDSEKILAERNQAVFEDVRSTYTDSEKRTLIEIQETCKSLIKCDREIDNMLKDYTDCEDDLRTIKGKIAEEGGRPANLDTQSVDTEFGTVRQLAKMTVGRQGNGFPILTGEFYHNLANSVGIRENVISILSWIESIDGDAFIRVYKNKPGRVVPYVILIPSYGDNGWCWQPMDKNNKATGRGRVCVPMYPKNLTIAVLTAIADFRWQAAKEKAAYMWMEEGVTGNYYQWFQNQKLKGDVRMYFIQDYILWMTKEAEGVQKLDKELRGTFWRYLPFTQAVKEKLKDRNLIYQELYQRDLNRAKSDM
jgi:hypothetical protein